MYFVFKFYSNNITVNEFKAFFFAFMILVCLKCAWITVSESMCFVFLCFGHFFKKRFCIIRYTLYISEQWTKKLSTVLKLWLWNSFELEHFLHADTKEETWFFNNYGHYFQNLKSGKWWNFFTIIVFAPLFLFLRYALIFIFFEEFWNVIYQVIFFLFFLD